MLSQDLTLAGDASSSRVYSLQALEKGGSLRSNSAATPGLPETLSIQHTERTDKSTKVTVQRHSVRLEKSVANAAGVPVKSTVFVVFEHHIDPAVTAAQIKDQFTQAKNLLDGTTIGKVLNNEP